MFILRHVLELILKYGLLTFKLDLVKYKRHEIDSEVHI